MAGILVANAAYSLRWPYIHDSPLMLYAAWHIAHGAVPYRDLFDMNMPGTYFAMWVLGAFFGWDDLGFRVFDLLCISLIGIATFGWMRHFGRAPALAAAMLFPLQYLALGPSTSMQREFLALVPLTMALALVESPCSASVRFFGTGLLAGAAALVKPQFLLLALPPMTYLTFTAAPSADRAKGMVWMAAGLVAPFVATFAFLAYRGALDAFIDIATNYWPLYTHLTGSHQPISGSARVAYLVTSTLEGLKNAYIPLALVGLAAALGDGQRRGLGWTIGAMTAAAAVYPSLSGQFWTYHWLPLQYMLLCAAALSVMTVPPSRWTFRSVMRAACALLTLAAVGTTAVRARIAASTGDPASDVVKSRARADRVPREVAAFLLAHLEPGDLVQPLDWTGGAVHGMLAARAPIATRFMYDFHFYHHVDTPYIVRLRRQFVRQLAAKRPRFVAQVLEGRPWPGGPGTTRSFPALQELLDSDYRVVHEGETYRILERITRAENRN